MSVHGIHELRRKGGNTNNYRKFNERVSVPNPVAEKLIKDYLVYTMRYSSMMQPKYEEADMDAIFAQALYDAAYTFKPGPASFLPWLKLHINGKISTLNKKRVRRSRGYKVRCKDSYIRRPFVTLHADHDIIQMTDERYSYNQGFENDYNPQGSPGY